MFYNIVSVSYSPGGLANVSRAVKAPVSTSLGSHTLSALSSVPYLPSTQKARHILPQLVNHITALQQNQDSEPPGVPCLYPVDSSLDFGGDDGVVCNVDVELAQGVEAEGVKTQAENEELR